MRRSAGGQTIPRTGFCQKQAVAPSSTLSCTPQRPVEALRLAQERHLAPSRFFRGVGYPQGLVTPLRASERLSERFHALFHPVGLELNQKPLYGLPVAWIVREVPDGRHGVIERPRSLEAVPEGRWGPLGEPDPLWALLLPAACLRACARLWPGVLCG